MDLSIVIPVYNEQDNVELLRSKMDAYLGTVSIKTELVFVDDGSVDASVERLCQKPFQNASVKIIKLSRNYGAHAAIRAGLQRATAEICMIYFIDVYKRQMEYTSIYRGGFDMAKSIKDDVKKQILDSCDKKANFVLLGGAGSGKTHTLVETINALYQRNKNLKIACITYTNVAADEIKQRAPYENLWVSTIHNFLWANIKNYRKNLKEAIIQLLIDKKIRYNGTKSIDSNFYINIDTIEYKEYRDVENGIITHDDIIVLANYMYFRYPLLQKILVDKYEYIFIDEYQDTHKEVIEIFLKLIKDKAYQKLAIGLFGDSMQSIYPKRVGDVNNYIKTGDIIPIIKDDNYRCSENVIKLINKLRNDGVVQKPANKNKLGSVKFLYSKKKITVAEIKKSHVFDEWDFNNIDDTKELYLTRTLIANEFGYSNLHEIFRRKPDNLYGDTKRSIIKHFLSIVAIEKFYDNKQYNKLINAINYKIRKASDKQILHNKVIKLKQGQSAGEVYELAHRLGLVAKRRELEDYIRKHEEEFENICKVDFQEFHKFYEYEEGFSPYSTQHGIKGAEFENVLVVLDNGGWNRYNFQDLFCPSVDKADIIERTNKMFYVTCSRAKNNLCVYYEKPSDAVLYKAGEWFGKENVIQI